MPETYTSFGRKPVENPHLKGPKGVTEGANAGIRFRSIYDLLPDVCPAAGRFNDIFQLMTFTALRFPGAALQKIRNNQLQFADVGT